MFKGLISCLWFPGCNCWTKTHLLVLITKKIVITSIDNCECGENNFADLENTYLLYIFLKMKWLQDLLTSRFLRSSGWSEQVFPEANVRKALTTIFENNVQQFKGGKMGAVNGFVTGARGHIDTSALQSEEVWTGVTYGLAALMIYEGTACVGAQGRL